MKVLYRSRDNPAIVTVRSASVCTQYSVCVYSSFLRSIMNFCLSQTSHCSNFTLHKLNRKLNISVIYTLPSYRDVSAARQVAMLFVLDVVPWHRVVMASRHFATSLYCAVCVVEILCHVVKPTYRVNKHSYHVIVA